MIVTRGLGRSGTSSTTLVSSGIGRSSIVAITGRILVYLAGTWQPKFVKVWDGTAWATKPLKYWTGSTWRRTPY